VMVEHKRLAYTVTFHDRPVAERSNLGIVVDGVDLGDDVALGRAERYATRETYPWLGAHSTAFNRSTGARIAVTHRPSKATYQVDVRMFDDAAAVRLEVPGNGRRVPDSAIGFRLPARSIVWSHDLVGHYEGIYKRRRVEDVTDGEWLAPPLTIGLPDGSGYAAITEAAL